MIGNAKNPIDCHKRHRLWNRLAVVAAKKRCLVGFFVPLLAQVRNATWFAFACQPITYIFHYLLLSFQDMYDLYMILWTSCLFPPLTKIIEIPDLSSMHFFTRSRFEVSEAFPQLGTCFPCARKRTSQKVCRRERLNMLARTSTRT